MALRAEAADGRMTDALSVVWGATDRLLDVPVARRLDNVLFYTAEVLRTVDTGRREACGVLLARLCLSDLELQALCGVLLSYRISMDAPLACVFDVARDVCVNYDAGLLQQRLLGRAMWDARPYEFAELA